MAIKFIVATLLLCVAVTVTSGLTSLTCDAPNGNYVIQPTAQAFITTILAQREAGVDGFGCGSEILEAYQFTESMRWALARLNQDSGRIGNRQITDSYIPGVKIGTNIMYWILFKVWTFFGCLAYHHSHLYIHVYHKLAYR